MNRESLIKNIQECKTNVGWSKLNVESIDTIQKFETSVPGEDLYIVKQKIKTGKSRLANVPRTHSLILDIVNEKGEVVAWVRVYTNILSSTKAEIEYAVSPALQGRGIATTLLHKIVEDVFVKGVLDGLFVGLDDDNLEKKTKIEKVFLSIDDDNIASQKVAGKCGFTYNDRSSYYELTSQQYLENNGLSQ